MSDFEYKVTTDINKAKIIITIVRHGLTKANEERRYIGWTDEGLSENGRALIEEMYKEPLTADLVFASPLKRCMQTADIIYKNHDLIIIPELKEMNFGDFEMRTHVEMEKDENYIQWLESKGEGIIPNGEGKEVFISRTMCGFKKCLSKCDKWLEDNATRKSIHAAIVAHGGTAMAIKSAIGAGEYFDSLIPNGGSYELMLERVQ